MLLHCSVKRLTQLYWKSHYKFYFNSSSCNDFYHTDFDDTNFDLERICFVVDHLWIDYIIFQENFKLHFELVQDLFNTFYYSKFVGNIFAKTNKKAPMTQYCSTCINSIKLISIWRKSRQCISKYEQKS